MAVIQVNQRPEPILTSAPQVSAGGTPAKASVSGLSMDKAERLLDWLENQGCTGLEAVFEGETTTVHFSCPPGCEIVKDEQDPTWPIRILPATFRTKNNVTNNVSPSLRGNS